MRVKQYSNYIQAKRKLTISVVTTYRLQKPFSSLKVVKCDLTMHSERR